MNYWVTFGASTISGLNPTFIQWRTTGGGSLPPPSISEPGSGGAYMFSYNALTQIFFVADGATTALAFSDRYVQGVVDPSDNFGFTLSGVAATLAVAGPIVMSNFSLSVQNFSLGVNSFSLLVANATLLGTTGATFGGLSTDPISVFGFLKRAQETREGNESYIKASGLLDSYSRGSSVLLVEKSIADNSTETTKT